MKSHVLITLVLAGSLAGTYGPEAGAREPLIEAQDRLERVFLAAHPGARIEGRVGAAPLAVASRLRVASEGGSDEERARAFLSRWSQVFGLEPFTLVHEKTVTFKGRRVVRFGLETHGLRVLQRQVAVTLDDGARILRVTSDVLPMGPLKARTLSPDQARAQAASAAGLDPEAPWKVHEAIDVQWMGSARVWVVELPGWATKVDAHTGALRGSLRRVHP